MSKLVKISYDSNSLKTQITMDDNVFDTSRIDGKEIADWVYPFLIKGIRWNGIYEELNTFLGETEDFSIQFDGTEKDLEILRTALKNTSVKVAGINNKVVILYKREPLSTKITVNGKIFDTSKLQNRFIDEWTVPFQFRDLKWNGIFKELEYFIGTDNYNIQFVGEQEDMKELMKECPENVSITYRIPTVSNGGFHTANLKEKGMGVLSNAQSAAKDAMQNLHNIDKDAIKGAVSKGVQNVQNIDTTAIKQKSSEMLQTAKDMSKADWLTFFKKKWKIIVSIAVAVILVLILLIKLLGTIFGGSTLKIKAEDTFTAMQCTHKCKAGSVGFYDMSDLTSSNDIVMGKLYFSANDYTTVYLIEGENGEGVETTAEESNLYERNSQYNYDTTLTSKDVNGDGYVEFTISKFNGIEYKKVCTIKGELK